jgi:hypothetical protein
LPLDRGMEADGELCGIHHRACKQSIVMDGV